MNGREVVGGGIVTVGTRSVKAKPKPKSLLLLLFVFVFHSKIALIKCSNVTPSPQYIPFSSHTNQTQGCFFLCKPLFQVLLLISVKRVVGNCNGKA